MRRLRRGPPAARVWKDLYRRGEIPPLGHVPERMHAWAIRKERMGPPEKSMQVEVVPTWPIRDDEALVHVMAGGGEHKRIWAALRHPAFGLHIFQASFLISRSDPA